MHLNTCALLSAIKGDWYFSALSLSHAERYRAVYTAYCASAPDKSSHILFIAAILSQRLSRDTRLEYV